MILQKHCCSATPSSSTVRLLSNQQLRVERQTIKELTREAVMWCLDTSKCIETKDLVDLVMDKKKSSNSENNGKYSESNNKESSPCAIKREQVDVMKVSGLIAT